MALFEEIKRDNGYRWTDEFTDSQLQDYTDDGKAYLSGYANDLDFVQPGVAKSLLKAYVRYRVAGAPILEFENNYRKELVRLSNKGMVQRRKVEDDDADV